ncbi:MAG TPA: SMP-30/gluconolactonase/LRE family protein [Candidatus Limnocylindrales bacterium]|nr:SMP-30/gluconolactonase/LRE family protein [Candidatus Limnocylindrales bacterium]
MNERVSLPYQFVRRARSLLTWAIAASIALLLGAGILIWRLGLFSNPGFIEYPMLRSTDIPTAIAVAPNGAVWFTIEFSDAIGLFRNGKIERLPKGSQNLVPVGLGVAADGSAWFTDVPARAISNISQSGKLTSFSLSTPIARLGKLAVAPDGAVWFAEPTSYSITRLKDGQFTRYQLESARGDPYGVAVDAQGTVWATLQSANKLVRISPDGKMTEIEVPTRGSTPTEIAVDATGVVWFTEFRTSKIGRYANGQFTEFQAPGNERSAITGLAIAPDGSVWFGMLRRHSLVRLHNGVLKEFRLPRRDARPYNLAVDAAGNVWYTDISGWLGMLPADQARVD